MTVEKRVSKTKDSAVVVAEKSNDGDDKAVSTEMPEEEAILNCLMWIFATFQLFSDSREY